jgi:1,4-dihydroxy-2-naphthoyl-CoA synthase
MRGEERNLSGSAISPTHNFHPMHRGGDVYLVNMFAQKFSRSISLTRRLLTTLKPSYDHIIAETRGKTGLITLNRPKALNALCTPLLADITHAAKAFDDDENIGAIVITGSEKAFAAGADIKEMSTKTFPHTYVANMFEDWTSVARIRKPVRLISIL